MSIMITILTAFAALEFVYIFYLETLQTTSEATSRVFNMSVETLKNGNITTLFKNQGVYNLMIAVGLIFGLIIGSREVVGFLLFNIIVVAVYGGLTSQMSIIWKQGGLAIITFLLLLIL
jgi:membrane protein